MAGVFTREDNPLPRLSYETANRLNRKPRPTLEMAKRDLKKYLIFDSFRTIEALRLFAALISFESSYISIGYVAWMLGVYVIDPTQLDVEEAVDKALEEINSCTGFKARVVRWHVAEDFFEDDMDYWSEKKPFDKEKPDIKSYIVFSCCEESRYSETKTSLVEGLITTAGISAYDAVDLVEDLDGVKLNRDLEHELTEELKIAYIKSLNYNPNYRRIWIARNFVNNIRESVGKLKKFNNIRSQAYIIKLAKECYDRRGSYCMVSEFLDEKCEYCIKLLR